MFSSFSHHKIHVLLTLAQVLSLHKHKVSTQHTSTSHAWLNLLSIKTRSINTIKQICHSGELLHNDIRVHLMLVQVFSLQIHKMLTQILYKWYFFYKHLVFRYVCTPHDCAKITSFELIYTVEHENFRMCLYIAYLASGAASLYIKTLYF